VKSELVKPSHLARKAVVYIRQSTPHRVVSNQESLRLQYALRQRARELGWHEADIDVIDTDLGLSGASAAQRGGCHAATNSATVESWKTMICDCCEMCESAAYLRFSLSLLAVA
jgi:hypothetical protein